MSNLDDTLARILDGAAAELDADADRGELLWSADDGARGYGRQDGPDAVFTTCLPGRPDAVHRLAGADYRAL